MALDAYVAAGILTQQQIDGLTDLVRQTLEIPQVLIFAQEKFFSTEQLLALTEPACLALQFPDNIKLLVKKRLTVQCVLGLNHFSQKMLSQSPVSFLLEDQALTSYTIEKITGIIDCFPEGSVRDTIGNEYVALFAAGCFHTVLSRGLFTIDELLAWPGSLKTRLDEIHTLLVKKYITKQELGKLKSVAAPLLDGNTLEFLIQRNGLSVIELNVFNVFDTQAIVYGLLNPIIRDLFLNKVLTLYDLTRISQSVLGAVISTSGVYHLLRKKKLSPAQLALIRHADTLSIAYPLLVDQTLTPEQFGALTDATAYLFENYMKPIADLLRKKILTFSDVQKVETYEQANILANPWVCRWLENKQITLEQALRLQPDQLFSSLTATSEQCSSMGPPIMSSAGASGFFPPAAESTSVHEQALMKDPLTQSGDSLCYQPF